MASVVRSLSPAHQIVEVSHSGAISPDDLRHSSIQAVTLLHELGASRVLTDCTDMTSSPGAIEMIALVDAVDALGLGTDFRQGLLWPIDARARLGFDFWRTVEENHGLRARAFGSREAAIEWLEQ